VSHSNGSRHQRNSNLRIYRAIPKGSRRARNQPQALRALEQRIALEADLGRLRADAETNARNIARALVFSAHWSTMVTRPGWDTLTERTGLSRSTIQRVIRRLKEWGLLGVVTTGSTWRTRGCRDGDTDGDLGAEYVLCVPADEPVEISDSPSLLRQEERSTPHVCARETAPEPAPRPWPIHQPPRTRGGRLAAARRLQDQVPLLARISDRQLRSALRPWFQLGWSPAQVMHALDHGPNGEQHWHTADVRHVPGWIRHRLGLWDGQTPPRQLGAGRSTDLEPAEVIKTPPPGHRNNADVPTHASLVRRMLDRTKRRSDKQERRGLGVCLPDREGHLMPAVADEPAVESGGAAGEGDWLLRNAAKQAEPDLMGAFLGLRLGVA